MTTNNIPKGTFQIALTEGIQYLTMALFYIVVAKTNALTQADIGALSILTFISSTIILITGLALPTALTKFASEHLGKNQPHEAASIVRTITKTIVILSLIGFVTASALSEPLSQYLFGTSGYAPLIILILIHTLLFNIISLCKSTLQALYLFGKMAVLTITFIAVSRIIGATLAILQMGLHGVLIGYLAGSIIAVAVAVIFVRGRFPKPTHNTPLKPILVFSLPLFLSSLTIFIRNWAGIMIVQFITLDYALTGIYYIVINSIGALSILYIPITTTIFPALSARYSLRNPEDITQIIRTSSRYLIYLILPSCIGLATISSTALTFFYGSTYALGAIALSILSIATIIIAFSSLLITALTAIGKTNQILKMNLISALSAVLILLTLVPFLHMIGAALARLVTQIVSLTLAIYVLRKYVNVQLDKEALWKAAIASTAFIPFLIILEATLTTRISTIPTLIIEILIAASIYLLGLYTLKALHTQDFELLKQSFPNALSKYISIIENIIVR